MESSEKCVLRFSGALLLLPSAPPLLPLAPPLLALLALEGGGEGVPCNEEREVSERVSR